MTEKSIKSIKAKNKQLKLKKPNVQSKAIDSDSDISEPDVSGKAPKMDQKELNMISSEVTDLLASLKKEHGMEDTPKVKSPTKKDKQSEKINKTKKDGKHVQNKANVVDVKKENKPQPKVEKLKPKQNENKKQKLAKAKAENNKKEIDSSVAAEPQENATKKKKNKNKKRAAADTEANEDEPQVKKVKETPSPNENQNKKQKQKQNQKQKPKPTEEEAKTDDDDIEEKSGEKSGENKVKKEHFLKGATPVFVGNLPKNIKRTKLVKLFKKYGKILSIRFRTNKGKPYYKKSQLDKIPFIIAFVFFDSPEAAKASLERSGTTIGEHIITVDMDTKEKHQIKPQQTVVIGNLKYATTDHTLREAFKCCGKIDHVHTVQSLKGCNGVAFIRFAKAESVALALKLNGTQILDREIRVERYSTKKSADAEKSGKKEKTPKPQKLGKNKPNAKGIKPKGMKEGGKPTDSKVGEKKKKTKEFMGAKSNDAKKALKNKKKKNKLSNEKRLAQKVAPKTEKASA